MSVWLLVYEVVRSQLLFLEGSRRQWRASIPIAGRVRWGYMGPATHNFFSRKIQDGHLGSPFLHEIHEEAGLDLCHEWDHHGEAWILVAWFVCPFFIEASNLPLLLWGWPCCLHHHWLCLSLSNKSWGSGLGLCLIMCMCGQFLQDDLLLFLLDIYLDKFSQDTKTHSKNNITRKIKMCYNFEWREYNLI